MLIAAMASTVAFGGPISWYWDGPASTPPEKLAAITASMDEAVDYYNAYSQYDWQEYSTDPRGIRVIYDANVPTANASYRGRISFGGSTGESTALHEMGHVFGVGTFEPTWTNRLSGGQWTGPAANAQLEEFDGPGAVVNGDGSHFWPYGLNFSTEDSLENRRRHVLMVGALRADMRLRNGSSSGVLGDYNDDGVVDAADYTVWRDRNGDTTSLVNDRFIGDVADNDYAWWKRAYGQPASSSALAVPEPTGLAAALLGTAVLTCGRLAQPNGRERLRRNS